MADEDHHEHIEHHSNKKFSIPKVELSRKDIAGIAFLALFVLAVSIPGWLPKGGCEVARPNYECASFEAVMIENCGYWGTYDCDTGADASLPQIEWYIQNLCNLQNQYHGTGLDCSNLKSACNQISQAQVC